jgi:integrase
MSMKRVPRKPDRYKRGGIYLCDLPTQLVTLLKASGEHVKTVQELMRHANSRMTLDVYAQALTSAKRAAHLKVVEMIRPTTGTPDVLICSYV